jgi:hypothetical protein
VGRTCDGAPHPALRPFSFAGGVESDDGCSRVGIAYQWTKSANCTGASGRLKDPVNRGCDQCIGSLPHSFCVRPPLRDPAADPSQRYRFPCQVVPAKGTGLLAGRPAKMPLWRRGTGRSEPVPPGRWAWAPPQRNPITPVPDRACPAWHCWSVGQHQWALVLDLGMSRAHLRVSRRRRTWRRAVQRRMSGSRGNSTNSGGTQPRVTTSRRSETGSVMAPGCLAAGGWGCRSGEPAAAVPR